MKTNEWRCNIVIRCCNEEQHIGRLLRDIVQQMIHDVELIAVDSGSSLNTNLNTMNLRLQNKRYGLYNLIKELNRAKL